jgi:hypothetical protein
MESTGHLHARLALPLGNSQCYPLYRSLGAHQSRSGRYGQEKYISPLLGTKPQSLGRPVRSLIAIPAPIPPVTSSFLRSNVFYVLFSTSLSLCSSRHAIDPTDQDSQQVTLTTAASLTHKRLSISIREGC